MLCNWEVQAICQVKKCFEISHENITLIFSVCLDMPMISAIKFLSLSQFNGMGINY